MRRVYRILSISTVAVLLVNVLFPAYAFAWKPTTHVALAEVALNDALDDGKVTIYRVDHQRGEIIGVVGEYQVDSSILSALQSNTAQYHAGVLGPDAYPDILTGQQVIHPGPTLTGISGGADAWLKYLWERSKSPEYDTPAVKAFVVGFLTHAAGDMFGHTMINHFTGGPFKITPPEGPENATKHIVLEGYIDKRVDRTDMDAEFFDASIAGVEDFIYHNMIDARPGSVLDTDLLTEQGGGSEFSVPRIYSTLRANLVQDISRLRQEANDCEFFNPTCSAIILDLKADYDEAWRDDIDSGLRAWPAVSHEVAKALFFNTSRHANTERAEEILDDYVTDHLLSMSGAPDFVGLTIGVIGDIIDAITPDFLLDPIRQLKEDLLDAILVNTVGLTKQELKEYLESPEIHFDPLMNSGAGEHISLQQFNRDVLHLNDPGYSDPNETFDYREVPAAYNTVTMSKLILLDQSELNRLLCDLGSWKALQEPNVMLGFVRSLDDSNQWIANVDKLVFARDSRVYGQIFMKQEGDIEGDSVLENVIFVDASFIGVEQGTRERPFNTVGEALSNVCNGTTIRIIAGEYSENLMFNYPVTIKSQGGRVILRSASK